jgi:carboxymethylenebutenolidase
MTTIDLQATTAVDGVSEGLSAYVARPSTPGPWPGVVVIQEAFGLDPVMRRQTDRGELRRPRPAPQGCSPHDQRGAAA